MENNNTYKFKYIELENLCKSLYNTINDKYIYVCEPSNPVPKKILRPNLDIINKLYKEYSALLKLEQEKQYIVTIRNNEVSILQDELFEEFNRNGLQENYEPNRYGLEIEDLIDKLNHPLPLAQDK